MHKLLIGIFIVFILFHLFNEGFAATSVTTVAPSAGMSCASYGTAPKGNEWIQSGSNCFLCPSTKATTCAAGQFLEKGLHATNKRCCAGAPVQAK